jgi:opacity protein-like surface antigen
VHALFRRAVFTLLATAAIAMTGSATAESAIDAQQPPAGDTATTDAADPAAVGLDEATVEAPPLPGPKKTLEFFITGAASKQFDADIDDGGSFDVDRYYVQGGLSLDLNPKTSISMGVGYAYDGYNFDGSTGFGAVRAFATRSTISGRCSSRRRSDSRRRRA